MKDKRYRVSVIIPAYNAGRYLKRCVLSAVGASAGELELIIIDDGSIDNTRQVLNKLRDRIMQNNDFVTMQIVHQYNTGPGYARNVGLSKASGDYIIFLDADDYLSKNSIDHMIQRMYIDGTDACLGKIRYVVAGIPVASSLGFWHNITTNTVNMSERNCIVEVPTGIGAKIFKRTLFEDFMFPTAMKWEDMPLILTLLAKAERVSLLREDVYNYNIHLNTTVEDFVFRSKVSDIVKGMDLLKANLIKLGLYERYERDYLSALVLHTMFRAQNALTWLDKKEVKRAAITDLLNALEARYPNWREDSVLCDEKYRYKDPFFNFLQRLLRNLKEP